MRLSPLDLQWVLNAEFLPLAAVTLVAGALEDRFGQKRIFLARIALYVWGARVFSTVGLGGLGAGLTNRSGLNLWVLVTLIIDLGGLAGLIVTERPGR
jgi:MFS family permease